MVVSRNHYTEWFRCRFLIRLKFGEIERRWPINNVLHMSVMLRPAGRDAESHSATVSEASIAMISTASSGSGARRTRRNECESQVCRDGCIAGLVCFVAGEDGYMTGQILAVNGGMEW